ncbi:MAG: hypothetical protein GC190_19655 [Alphaproteobacteria bacterium]|nr:hypothetical protein [Alphaproteobacteria bacterium]
MSAAPASSDDTKIDVQKLWAKYEDIAMHFNDLLMRLRSQSLAGIAALSTIVGVLAKGDVASMRVSWFVAAMIFVAMALFWVAIWCLDFLYYNRLLRGAVSALAQIEQESRQPTSFKSGINMSTLIEGEFSKPLMHEDVRHFRGVLLFYGIVLFAIVGGALFCLSMHWQDP